MRKTISALGLLLTVAGTYLALASLQRLTYIVWILVEGQTPSHLSLLTFVKGGLFDLASSFFLFAPLAAFLACVPKSQATRQWARGVTLVLAGFPLFLATSSALGEIFFFQEFHARFNFIAVDYLIYTTEVVRNVLESYSGALLAVGLVAPITVIMYLFVRQLRRLDPTRSTLRQSWPQTLAILVVVASCAAFVNENNLIKHDEYWPRELAKNSLFALFTAYYHNSINYHEFYSSMDESTARKLARTELQGNFIPSDQEMVRDIRSPTPAKDWNVVMVVMESMGAGFLGHFGNRQPITPNLDRLADDGLLFTKLYATGTRTVRGLEALMLSLPPTPGQSILRRPNSDQLFNLGSVFSANGYKTQFIYGGYSYFDNMREWFESNGFEIKDRGDFPSSEIQFANAWGVCDEDLFAQVLKQQAEITATGRPFFQVVLTTSNHRPYTYPEGKIDMPPRNGREGAIKYADYSIGKFIEGARATPWFNKTLFIFVADHDASVAGGTDIPVEDYLIPAIFYNPQLIKPGKMEKLASQIDLAPTLLSMLGFSYKSKFFGEDIFTVTPNRAYLGTYQKVARLEPGHLTILAPGRSIEIQTLDENFKVKARTSESGNDHEKLPRSARETIAVYQTASELFAQGHLKNQSHSITAAIKH